MKVAAKDRVDPIMFLIFAVLSVLDFRYHMMGAVGFQTFFTFWLLMRLATLKREMQKAGMIK